MKFLCTFSVWSGVWSLLHIWGILELPRYSGNTLLPIVRISQWNYKLSTAPSKVLPFLDIVFYTHLKDKNPWRIFLWFFLLFQAINSCKSMNFILQIYKKKAMNHNLIHCYTGVVIQKSIGVFWKVTVSVRVWTHLFVFS